LETGERVIERMLGLSAASPRRVGVEFE
jgi:hypothetical protein